MKGKTKYNAPPLDLKTVKSFFKISCLLSQLSETLPAMLERI